MKRGRTGRPMKRDDEAGRGWIEKRAFSTFSARLIISLARFLASSLLAVVFRMAYSSGTSSSCYTSSSRLSEYSGTLFLKLTSALWPFAQLSIDVAANKQASK